VSVGGVRDATPVQTLTANMCPSDLRCDAAGGVSRQGPDSHFNKRNHGHRQSGSVSGGGDADDRHQTAALQNA
jgi:hypothetical protein